MRRASRSSAFATWIRVLARRRAAYDAAQRLLAQDLPVLPLWQPDTVAVVRRGTTLDVPRDGRFGTLAF